MAGTLKNNSISNSEKLFQSIFHEAGVGIAIIDKDLKIVKFNKTFSNLFGYEPEEISGKTYLDIIPERKRENASKIIHDMFSSKLDKFQAEEIYLKKNNEPIWFKLTASVIHDDNGKPEFIIGIGEDITEFKRQENIRDVVYKISSTLNYSNNLHKLIDSLKESLNSIINSEHFFIALYDELKNVFNIPCVVNEKETFQTFSAEATLEQYVIQQKKPVLLNNNEILKLQSENEILIKDKVLKHWLGIPLLSKEDVIGVIGVQSYEDENAFDQDDLAILEILSNQISSAIQKMRSEDDLKIERAYFKELFDNSPEAIAVVDNESIIININNEFTNLFGYTKQDAIHKPIEDLISTAGYKLEAQNFTSEIAKGKVVKVDTKRRKKDGSIVDVSLWGAPIKLDKGNIAVFAIFRDISERVEAEQKLEKAKEKAEESDKLKTAFLTNMSHEIRTPMNAIIGFSELIAEPSTDQDSRREFAGQIYESSRMLLKLIDDIIDISQLDSGNLKLTISKFNVTKVLNELYKKFEGEREKEEKEKIELLLHNPFGDSITYLETDEFRFKQIFSHLLNNALKYTHDGFIEFGFDINQKEEPIFYVRDTGIGIPEDKTDTIFNHFTKIEDRRKLYRGTGIGLTITKKLVNVLGGEIWVESNVGIGSIFYFTLPKKVSLLEIKSTNKEAPQKNYNWAGKTILVAEDEDSNYEVIKASLSRTHANLQRVFNGKEAVEICTNKNIDIVLMDIMMPVLGGIEATKKIKAINPKLPIIAQTAFVHRNEREICLEAGCNEYLPKPTKSYVLLEKIDQFFSNGL